MIPPYGITKDEHDAVAAARGRPYTDTPTQRRTNNPTPAASQSFTEWLMGQAEAGKL